MLAIIGATEKHFTTRERVETEYDSVACFRWFSVDYRMRNAIIRALKPMQKIAATSMEPRLVRMEGPP